MVARRRTTLLPLRMHPSFEHTTTKGAAPTFAIAHTQQLVQLQIPLHLLLIVVMLLLLPLSLRSPPLVAVQHCLHSAAEGNCHGANKSR